MSSPRVDAPVRPRPPRFCARNVSSVRALDEAVAGDGDHHLARLDQALVVLVGQRVDDVGHAAAWPAPRAPWPVRRASPPCGADARPGCPAGRGFPRRSRSGRRGSSRAPARSGVAAGCPGCRAPARRSGARCPPGLITLPGSSISASSGPISAAGQSRAISAARAAAASGLARISRITSSMSATAMARPTKLVRAVARLAPARTGRGAGSLPRGSG